MYFCARFLKTDMAQFTEEDKIMRRVEQRFNKGMVKYRLIEDGDKILVGLSGGKDSLALLELLAKRSRILKPRFTVMAVHIGMTNIPYQSDLEYLKNYAEGLGVPFVYFETSFDLSTDTRKSPCFLCSWNRRKALFTVAKEHGCTKIALGHHMDDILETLLMTIIRPMCLVHESDLSDMARVRGYRRQIKNCPYESRSNRSDMKEVLKSLEKLNPEARYSLWGSMTNIQEDLLPDKID